MKKIIIHKPGSYDQLKIEELPDPEPGPGQILIETRAIGVNFADCCIRMGVYRSAREFIGWPITPGFEVSGIVKGLGEGVVRYRIGDPVLAITLFGGYSTHVIANEESVFPLPAALDFIEAAAIPAIYMTAYYGMFYLAHPKKGDKILVHSAAGGVGSTLMQFGRLFGCEMVGVVGATHKRQYVESLGASCIIDKSSENLWAKAESFAPKGYDVIFDANGAETLRQSYNHLCPGGKLVVYGFHSMLTRGRGTPQWFKVLWDYARTPRFNPLNMTNDNHSVLAFNLSYLFDRKDLLIEGLNQVLSWINERKVFPPPTQTFPLDQVAEAHRWLESGQSIGKIVLLP